MKTEKEMTDEELCKLIYIYTLRLYKAKAELIKKELEVQIEINKLFGC